MIKTENLTKKFGENLAVDRLTLEIGEGEVFGFLGPNGAGKTTTVRMLTSLIAPTAGTATVMGYDIIKDDQNIRRNVGILTETPGLYDRLSAWRNMTIFANLYEVKDGESKMPANLRAAHDCNDEVLERIYIGRRFKNDTERLEKLFELYTKMTTKDLTKTNSRMKA